MAYKRVLLKLSGEAVKANSTGIFDPEKVEEINSMISALVKQGIQVCVVMGAGNIWRGRIAETLGLSRVPADFMGMLGTVINGVALSNNLVNKGIDSIVTSCVPEIDGVTYKYTKEFADEALKENKVVFLAGGTGKPFFTTDTAAAIRAIELNCDAILIGKNGVDGVYSADPKLDKNAKFFSTITYDTMIDMQLKIIDDSAVELLKNKDIDVRIFSMDDVNNFIKVANGEHIGTILNKG